MEIEFNFEFKAKNGRWEKGRGVTEISEEKIEMIFRKCEEYKCSFTSVIEHIIENLTEESADQLIGTMMFW